MATNHYRGNGNMHLQRGVVKYGPQTGFLREYEYRGLSATQAQVIANQWAAAGAEYALTNQLGIHTLVVSDPTAVGGSGSEVVIDVWEIGVDAVTKNSFYNVKNTNKLMDLNTHDKSEFLNGVQNKDSWAKVYAALEYSGKAANEAALKRVYDRFSDGSDSFYSSRYVVRHTTNVSNRYPYNVADTNVNRIYTPAQFYTEVQSVLLWLFPMPNAYVNVLTSNAVPVISGALSAYYLWGYLKTGSPRHTVANNRTEIVTEYRQDLWSLDEYQTV